MHDALPPSSLLCNGFIEFPRSPRSESFSITVVFHSLLSLPIGFVVARWKCRCDIEHKLNRGVACSAIS